MTLQSLRRFAGRLALSVCLILYRRLVAAGSAATRQSIR